MIRVLRWLLVLAGITVLLPLSAFVGFGLWYGLDVGNAFYALVVKPTGTTIAPEQVPYRQVDVRWLGNIDNLDLDEASGLDVSTRDPQLLWAINDSANEPRLFALSPQGAHLGSWAVALPALGDWEDLSSFKIDGTSYLLIADVGDNFRWRRVLNLYILREPLLRDLTDSTILHAERTIAFTYPDGPRDSEAVAVDTATREILILSKRVIPAEVYRLPLDAPEDYVVTAERIALLTGIPQPVERDLYEDPDHGSGRSTPTALDVHGNSALVLTYKDAFLFERQANEAWSAAFARIPQRVALPRTHQQEAAAFARDGRSFYTTIERPHGRDAAGIYQVLLDTPLDREGAR